MLDVVNSGIRVFLDRLLIAMPDVRVLAVKSGVAYRPRYFQIPGRLILHSHRVHSLSALRGLPGTVRHLWTALSHQGIPVGQGGVIVVLAVGGQCFQLVFRVFRISAHLPSDGVRAVPVVLHHVNIGFPLACVPSGVGYLPVEFHPGDRLKAIS